MTEEKSKTFLLESVFCSKAMDMVFSENSIHYRTIKMAGMIDYKNRRFQQLVCLLLHLKEISLGTK